MVNLFFFIIIIIIIIFIVIYLPLEMGVLWNSVDANLTIRILSPQIRIVLCAFPINLNTDIYRWD